MSERFLISKRGTGLGSDMATLVGAWDYAKQTSRTLVIDWRNSRYLSDRLVNAFPRLFQQLDRVNGVNIISDDSVSERSYPEPVLTLYSVGRAKYLDLLSPETDIQAATLLNRIPMHVFPSLRMQREFLTALRLHDSVQRKFAEFNQSEFAGATVIGVHFRHGNGEALGIRHNAGLKESCRKIALSCRQLSRQFGNPRIRPPRIFVSTDSQEAEECLRSMLSNVVTRPKKFRKAGAGPLHVRALGLANAQDALIEMFLLARCNALVYSNSWFSYYARTIGRFAVAPVWVIHHRHTPRGHCDAVPRTETSWVAALRSKALPLMVTSAVATGYHEKSAIRIPNGPVAVKFGK